MAGPSGRMISLTRLCARSSGGHERTSLSAIRPATRPFADTRIAAVTVVCEGDPDSVGDGGCGVNRDGITHHQVANPFAAEYLLDDDALVTGRRGAFEKTAR